MYRTSSGVKSKPPAPSKRERRRGKGGRRQDYGALLYGSASEPRYVIDVYGLTVVSALKCDHKRIRDDGAGLLVQAGC